jgi:diguanylate cyclase (GGDEF)-like protein/putative nucleotidyltransferase with HDIG domain
MNWVELPVKLKILILVLTCLAIPIAIMAGSELATGQHNSNWIVLLFLTVLTVPFFLFLPSFNASISVGDAYIMAIAMIYGTAPCIATTFCHTLLISIFAKRPNFYMYRVVFNTSSTICVAWLCSTIFHALNPIGTSIPSLIIPAAVLVCTYFLANSILTSIAIAWSVGENIGKFWAKTCLPLAVDYSVSSVSATFIVALNSFNEIAPIAAAPLVGVVWGWNKLNKTRAIELENHLKEQEELYLRTVESLALAVDAKDQTTYGHIRRVRVYATGLARLCGIKDPNELKAIETGSLLHDIGKLAIDDYILNKPGKLSKQEFEKIKMHASAGDEILQQIRFPFPVAKYVRCHHERWDGLGYPDGLRGEDIPLGARILAIADAFDAIRFSRPYKLPIATDEAVEILRAQSGTVYDPKLVQLFIDHVKELEDAATRESGSVPELSFRKSFETVDRALLNADTSAANTLASAKGPEELLHVAEFCNSILGRLDLKDIFPVFSRRIEKLIAFSACAFYLDDGNDGVQAAYVSGKASEALKGHRISMGKGISGWVAAHRRPMINTGPALDFQDVHGDFADFTDALVVPVTFDDECLGTISLYAQNPVSYNQKDLSVLQALAGFLAPLIADAKRRETSGPEDFTDPATQIYRVTYLTAVGPQLISVAATTQSPISLIYLEIRNLYQIIRIYGEHVGNAILKRIADCVKPELRETDILVRYGHQGFVVLLPGVRAAQADRCGQRLQQRIRSEGLSVVGQNFSIDCGAGISHYPKDGSTIFGLLQSAQENLKTSASEPDSGDSNVVGFFPRA